MAEREAGARFKMGRGGETLNETKPIRGWIRMSAAAKYMEMTRRGASRYLQRLQEVNPSVQLLRQYAPGSPIEVNAHAMKALVDGRIDLADAAQKELTGRVEDLELKVEGVRARLRTNSKNLETTRVEFNEKLERQGRRIDALKKSHDAHEELLRTFSETESRTG